MAEPEQQRPGQEQGSIQKARERVLATAKAEGVRFINLEFTDVVGMAKCVTIPIAQFADCVTHGKWFDGSALEGFARIAESDMYLYPDLDTFAILPGQIGPQSAAAIGRAAKYFGRSDNRWRRCGADHLQCAHARQRIF